VKSVYFVSFVIKEVHQVLNVKNVQQIVKTIKMQNLAKLVKVYTIFMIPNATMNVLIKPLMLEVIHAKIALMTVLIALLLQSVILVI